MRRRVFARHGVLACLAAASCWASNGEGSNVSSLIEALKQRDQKAFISLLNAPVDVNKPQPDGATALSWAAYLNENDAADALLKAGAKVNVVDDYGETPLTLACANGNGDLVTKLLDAGAEANA